MPRWKRPYLPGLIFHLTARTQGHQPWFEKRLRTQLIGIIKEGVQSTEMWLLAYAIMPNHLHLVVRHGKEPLGHVLQPVLRRIAYLMQREHELEGHVFERRFRAHPCTDPEYARNAIVYTHLNPVRAGMCHDALEYPWTSHRVYQSPDMWGAVISRHHANIALRLFASADTNTLSELHGNYTQFVNWRLAHDLYKMRLGTVNGKIAEPRAPTLSAGDAHWCRFFCASRRTAEPEATATTLRPLIDLRDLARNVLAENDWQHDLDWIRNSGKTPDQVKARRRIIRVAVAAGHRRIKIARFLRISPATVSRALK